MTTFSTHNSRRTPRNADGFSMVEVIVVMIIIGMLLAITVPVMASSRKTATINQLKAQARSYSDAVNEFQRDHGGRPPYMGAAEEWPTGTTKDRLSGPVRSLDKRPYMRSAGHEGFTGAGRWTTLQVTDATVPSIGPALVYQRVGQFDFEIQVYIDGKFICRESRLSNATGTCA